MGKYIDLTGQRFGRLIVIQREGTNKHGKVTWRCICDCGIETVVCGSELRCGDTKSCGCLQREWAAEHSEYARTVHSHNHRPRNWNLYSIWRAMLSRCENPKNKSYVNYGGRGITVCDIWRRDFFAFQSWAFDNGYVKGLTIDRIDNDGGYSPSNCRWTSYAVQNINTRRNVFLEYRGERRTISEWAKITGCSHALIWQRIHVLGWSIEQALTEPIKKNR